MKAPPEAWLRAEQALIHGEDGDARKGAVNAWMARHVDPEWVDFSLTVCREGCPWPEVLGALSEAAPLGASRVVVVPQADALLAKPRELPAPVQDILRSPIPDTRLLLVCRNTLAGGPGRPLGSRPWSEWLKEGRVLKVGALEGAEIQSFVEAWAREHGLILDSAVSALIGSRVGSHPGILRRTLEVLDLLAADRRLTEDLVNTATFRLAEQSVFAWSQAWQKGQAAQALSALRIALEDDPAGAPLLLLGQARREVDRLARLLESREAGVQGPDLVAALGLSPKQGWLLEGLQRTLDRLGPSGLRRLIGQISQTDRDLKGEALSGAATTLTALTLDLCGAWGQK